MDDDQFYREACDYYGRRFGTVDQAKVDHLEELRERADSLGHSDWAVSLADRLVELADEDISTALAIREATEDDDVSDRIEERLREGVLDVSLDSVTGRGDVTWSILLGTGGPADRVLVSATMDGEIERARYEYQDWFKPWTEPLNQDGDTVEAFASLFYFGTVGLTVDGSEV